MNVEMDRRQLLAALAGGALTACVGHTMASAETDHGSYTREFETDDLRMRGGILYLFTAILMPSESLAENTYDNMVEALEDSEGSVLFEDIDDLVLVGFEREQGPDIGDQSTAYVMSLTDDDYTFSAELVLAFVQRGRVVHAAAGLGLERVLRELNGIAEDALRLTVTKVKRLERAVPEVDDLPSGFYVTDEGFNDDDDGLPGLPGQTMQRGPFIDTRGLFAALV